MTPDQTTPRVTAVIPAYCHTPDHERFLVEALHSVTEQTYRDFDVLIVDDSSPRDIRPLVASVEGLPAVRIVRNATNLGHAEARNVGIRESHGDMLAFLDHDDLWSATKLERQVAALDAEPDAGMVFCDVRILGEHPRGLYVDQGTVPDRPSLTWFVTHNNSVITVSSVLVRKTAMLDIGLFDSRYSSCDDFDAWIKILMLRPVLHLRETLATYRLHAHNVNYRVDRLNDNRLLTALLLRVWAGLPTTGKLRMLPTLARKLLGRVYLAVRRT